MTIAAERDGTAFWSEFVEQAWERAEALIPSVAAAGLPTIGTGELFAAVVACADEFWRTGRQRVRFYVEDGVEVDVRGGRHGELLPCAADGSFEGYERRIARLGIAEFGLVVADWHQFHRSAWERILLAVHRLVERVPISGSRMDTQVFVGNYRTTPFGVHVDATGGFHFPVIGTKTMRFWTPEQAECHPGLQRSQEYRAHVGCSTALTAGPGEAMYWPSDRWHVGESDGSFSVTWGFGYWFGNGMEQMALEQATAALAAASAATGGCTAADLPRAASTAAAIDDLLSRLTALVESMEVRDRVTQRWLEHHSGYGFLRLPPAGRLVHVEDAVVVRRRLPLPILLAPLGTGELCLASMGCSRVVPGHPMIVDVVDRLNAGAELSMASAGVAGDEAVRFVLGFCLAAGGLERA